MPQTLMIGAADPNIAYLLNRYAQESGFQTHPVSQDQNVLDLACHFQPAVILLDIEFVESVDWEIPSRLKADPAVSNIPIILYSCLGDLPEDWREGVDGFLLKSPLYDDFVAVLQRAGLRQPSANHD